MTMTEPTPIFPIPTSLHHSQVIRIIPEHPLPILNPLAPSQASSCLNNTLLNPLAPSRANLHLMHSWTLWLPCISLMRSRHYTHSQPNPTLLWPPLSSCIKSIPNNSSVSWLWLGKAWSCTSLAQCVLVCLSSPSIYLFPSCPLYVPLSHHSLPSARFSMSPQFPVSIYPHFIYLYFIFLSTLPYYSILTLQLIPDHSDYPDPYHTPHLYKYCSTSCCSSVW